jgi:hypothetical protein
LIEDYAAKHNLDPKLVKAVVKSYYKEVKFHMSTLEHLRINLVGLGKFYVLFYKFDTVIQKYQNMMNSIPPTSFQNIAKYKQLEEKLNRLMLLKQKHENEREQIRQYKEARKANRSSL